MIFFVHRNVQMCGVSKFPGCRDSGIYTRADEQANVYSGLRWKYICECPAQEQKLHLYHHEYRFSRKLSTRVCLQYKVSRKLPSNLWRKRRIQLQKRYAHQQPQYRNQNSKFYIFELILNFVFRCESYKGFQLQRLGKPRTRSYHSNAIQFISTNVLSPDRQDHVKETG